MRKLAVFLMAAACVVSTQQVRAAELSGTLKKIKDTGVLTIGYRDSSVPFSYLDENQKPIGFALDVCYKVAAAVKATLQLADLDVKLNAVVPSTRILLVANGTIDLECGSTTNNPERQKQVTFTNSHFLTATRFVSKKSSHLQTFDDLKGKTVASTSGSTNIKQINEANTERKLGLTILAAKDHADAFLMVQTGRAVAFVMDDVLLASFVASSKTPEDYVISDDTLSKPEPYGIMLRKDDLPFKELVDTATATLFKSPDGKALYARWFEQPIPPRGINLNLPMSDAMRKQFSTPIDSPDPAAY